MTEPGYLTQARRYLGQKEIAGVGSNPWIRALWAAEAWLGNDDSLVPWCGLFMRFVMRAAGFPVPKNPWRAASWLTWGVPLITPAVGAVVVFKRPGGYHVGIVVGIDAQGRLVVLGGNQGDAVKYSLFNVKDRPPEGYRWASSLPKPAGEKLPVLSLSGLSLSSSEA